MNLEMARKLASKIQSVFNSNINTHEVAVFNALSFSQLSPELHLNESHEHVLAPEIWCVVMLKYLRLPLEWLKTRSNHGLCRLSHTSLQPARKVCHQHHDTTILCNNTNVPCELQAHNSVNSLQARTHTCRSVGLGG